MAWGHTAILQFAFYNLTFTLSFSCLRAFVVKISNALSKLAAYQFKFAAGIASPCAAGQSASQKPASGTEA